VRNIFQKEKLSNTSEPKSGEQKSTENGVTRIYELSFWIALRRISGSMVKIVKVLERVLTKFRLWTLYSYFLEAVLSDCPVGLYYVTSWIPDRWIIKQHTTIQNYFHVILKIVVPRERCREACVNRSKLLMLRGPQCPWWTHTDHEYRTLLWDLYKTHKCTVWVKYRVSNVAEGGIYSNRITLFLCILLHDASSSQIT
jgi:hypothetical protein